MRRATSEGFRSTLADAEHVLADLDMLLGALRGGPVRELSTPLKVYGKPEGAKVWPALALSIMYLNSYVQAMQKAYLKLPARERFGLQRPTVAELEAAVRDLEARLDGLELRLAEAREAELAETA